LSWGDGAGTDLSRSTAGAAAGATHRAGCEHPRRVPSNRTSHDESDGVINAEPDGGTVRWGCRPGHVGCVSALLRVVPGDPV